MPKTVINLAADETTAATWPKDTAEAIAKVVEVFSPEYTARAVPGVYNAFYRVAVVGPFAGIKYVVT